MNILKTIITILLMASVNAAMAKIVGKEVTYSANGVDLKGYIAYDDSIKEKRPGVLVVHEWWGQNEYTRMRANMLAEEGYVALALDMFGEGKQADHPQEAGKFASEISSNLDIAEKRFVAAYDFLKQQSQTDKNQIAAIGYCFGGGIVLAMARRGVDLEGVVSFHGSLGVGAPAKKGEVKAKVLVLHGEDDPLVKREQIEAFKKEMKSAKVDYDFISYPGAKHAFTNPNATKLGEKFSMPIAYNKNADIKSWEKMREFFNEIFRKD